MNRSISKKKQFPFNKINFTQKGYRNVVNVEIDILKYWKNLKRIDLLLFLPSDNGNDRFS